MGIACRKRKQLIYDKFNNYHCKICGEIPLINFSNFDFDIMCSKHKILNIQYEQFYNYISLDYSCSFCNQISNKNNLVYCYDCDEIYCNKCIDTHNQNDISSNHFFINNIYEKNIICSLHNKLYDRFCLICKLNLCESCQNDFNHYTEIFNDIYPSEEELIQFKNLAVKILRNIKNSRILIDEENNEDEMLNSNQENECINIKLLFIESFSKEIANYNYINNINNIIRCTFQQNTYFKNIKNDIKFIEMNDINSIKNKLLIKSLSKNKTNDINSQSLCMKKLNNIQIDNSQKKFELIAIGGSNHKILILDVLNFSIYQLIEEHKSSVYSLAQFDNDSKFLFSSSEDCYINIYKLNSNYKYEIFQRRKKSIKERGINKIILLSNKFLVSGDHRSITIWKSNSLDENEINYKQFYEIILNRDVCQLLEVNPSIFVATQYSHGGYFQVYKNDENHFPLKDELTNIKSHDCSSNGLAKINDNLVCSATENLFYIISIEPLQIIQKIRMNYERGFTIFYLYVTLDNFLYCKGDYQSIIQYKIIKDQNNNFIELIEIGKYNNDLRNTSFEKAILPFDDGRIFLVEEKVGDSRYILIS